MAAHCGADPADRGPFCGGEAGIRGAGICYPPGRRSRRDRDLAPEETLYCFATTSDSWNGIRVRVILDGREQEVRKLTSIGDRLYSTEETYIGRDRLEGSGT